MSRAWRIEFEGALYHVLSRGNARADIFLDDKDRLLFLDLLGEMSDRFAVDVYAYVLMGNHYHFLLKTRLGNLSKSMQWFSVSYTRKFNVRHNESGHLFQGRFKSFLVEDDAYLMRLSCYIHRNPLRAEIINRLAYYPWSSYPVYAYGKKSPPWLNTSLILSQFTGNEKEKHLAYRQKVQTYAKEEKHMWEDFRHGLFLGTQEFIDRMRNAYLPKRPHQEIPQQRQTTRVIDPLQILRKASRIMGCDLNDFQSARRLNGLRKTNRDMLIYLLWATGRYKNEEIGNLFGVSYTAVSKSVTFVKNRMANDKAMMSLYEGLKEQFKM